MEKTSPKPTDGKHGGGLDESAGRWLTGALCVFAGSLPLSIAGANIGWALALAALLACLRRGHSIPWSARKSAVEKPLIVFICAALISSAFGIFPYNSFRYFNQDFHKLWLYYLLSIVLFFHVQQDPLSKRVRPILTALGVGFTIASVIGIWQIIDTLDLPLGWRLRAQAFVHPATYGEQMCVGLLGAVSFLFFPPPGKNPQKTRKFAIFFALATGLALLLSNTRGALASCIIAFLAMGFLVPAVRRYFFWIFAAAVLGLIAMESFRTDRSLLVTVMKWNTKASHQGQFMRLHLWDAAWRIGQDHIWTGVGHNNFRIIFPQYARLLMEDGTFTWGTAHNLYLHHFAERGLIGLSAVLCVLASFWKRALDRVRKNPDGFNLWAFGTTTSFIFMNMTEVAFQVEILWMLVFFVWIWAETRHTFFQQKKNND